MNKNLIYGLIAAAGIFLVWLINLDQQTEHESQQPTFDRPGKTGQKLLIGSLEISVPRGWIEEKPRSSMRSAQFRLPRVNGDPEDAEVAVFNRIGGSVEQNIDRWVNQFSQPNGKPSKGLERTKEFVVNDLTITLIYLEGIYASRGLNMTGPVMEKPGYSLLAAIVKTPSGPYYFKTTGPVKTVQSWAGSFDELTQSFLYRGSL